MAEVRKSATQTAARKRAREKAAAFREKQDKLEQLAVDYFVATDGLESIQKDIDRELAAVRARGDKRLAASQAEADRVIADMLDLGAPRNEVADRLGIPTRDVKKTSASRKPAASSTSPAPSLDGVEVMASEPSEAAGPA